MARAARRLRRPSWRAIPAEKRNIMSPVVDGPDGPASSRSQREGRIVESRPPYPIGSRQ